MAFLEPLATVFGVACLYLLIRQSIWAWPVGIVMTGLYAVIFFNAQLYANFGLQIIFCALQIYGWWFWLSHRDRAEANDKAPIKVLSGRVLATWLCVGAIGVVVLGYGLARFTDGAAPFWDAGVTSFSLVAQFLLARKYLQNWLVWIGVDVVAVGLYFSQGLHLTSGLYVLFLLMCIWGYWEWKRDMAKVEPAPEAA